MLKESLFYAKILLFGEYGIIDDAMGLSIPYTDYSGTFSYSETEKSEKSNADLKQFYNYLKSLQEKNKLIAPLDLDKFGEEINKGIHFSSSIPQGYGVGSSGALVAAVYQRYSNEIISVDKANDSHYLMLLKQIFGQMESFFHGKSSGLDPLICYLQIPILVKSKTDLNSVGLPLQGTGKGAIFLLDTGETGATQPLVEWFMEQLKEKGFRKMFQEQFKKYNDDCIKDFLKGDSKPLFKNIKKLSTLLLDNFKPMIPQVFHKLWLEGINSGNYYLKLCGSGGGGYILGFTQDIQQAQKSLAKHKLEVIHRF